MKVNIRIPLYTNVEDTDDFKRLLDQKTVETILLFIRNQYKKGKLEIEKEIIKQQDDHKDAELWIKSIRFK